MNLSNGEPAEGSMSHLDDLAQDRVRAGEGSPEEAAHVLECLQCMVEVEVLRFTANSMRDAQAIEIPAEVDQAILASRPAVKASGASPSRWAVMAGSAAAVFVVALTLTFMLPAQANVVDAYKVAVRGGDPSSILARCTSLGSVRPVKTDGNRFAVVDVYLEAGDRKLAAWQVEISTANRAAIVGVEGGEPAAYREPPAYDPAAMQGGLIILAALTTGDAPAGRVRVARLHLMEKDKTVLIGKVVAAAAPGGERFEAKLDFKRQGE